MKITTVVIVVLIALFFLMPLLSGYTSIPHSVSPGDIGDFAHGILKYWIIVLKRIF